MTEIELAESYKAAFLNPIGRKVLADLLVQCRVFLHCADQVDEGARRVGLYIMSQIIYEKKDLKSREMPDTFFPEAFPEFMQRIREDNAA